MKTITIDEPLDPKLCADELTAASRDAGHEGWVLARQHEGRWYHVPEQSRDAFASLGETIYRVCVDVSAGFVDGLESWLEQDAN